MDDKYGKMLKPEDVMVRLNISRDHVYKISKRDGFPAVRVGGMLRVPEKALDEWIELQLRADGADKNCAPGRGAKKRPLGQDGILN
jgi:excisionase family DNA binding protein